MRLTAEDTDLPGTFLQVASASWPEIEKAIRRMDGNKRSTVSISSEEKTEQFMGIGGGENGVYVCFVIDECGDEFLLVNPQERSNEYMDVFMGQMNIRSRKEAMDVETILAVAKVYFETGRMSNQHTWKQ